MGIHFMNDFIRKTVAEADTALPADISLQELVEKILQKWGKSSEDTDVPPPPDPEWIAAVELSSCESELDGETAVTATQLPSQIDGGLDASAGAFNPVANLIIDGSSFVHWLVDRCYGNNIKRKVFGGDACGILTEITFFLEEMRRYRIHVDLYMDSPGGDVVAAQYKVETRRSRQREGDLAQLQLVEYLEGHSTRQPDVILPEHGLFRALAERLLCASSVVTRHDIVGEADPYIGARLANGSTAWEGRPCIGILSSDTDFVCMKNVDNVPWIPISQLEMDAAAGIFRMAPVFQDLVANALQIPARLLPLVGVLSCNDYTGPLAEDIADTEYGDELLAALEGSSDETVKSQLGFRLSAYLSIATLAPTDVASWIRKSICCCDHATIGDICCACGKHNDITATTLQEIAQNRPPLGAALQYAYRFYHGTAPLIDACIFAAESGRLHSGCEACEVFRAAPLVLARLHDRKVFGSNIMTSLHHLSISSDGTTSSDSRSDHFGLLPGPVPEAGEWHDAWVRLWWRLVQIVFSMPVTTSLPINWSITMEHHKGDVECTATLARDTAHYLSLLDCAAAMRQGNGRDISKDVSSWDSWLRRLCFERCTTVSLWDESCLPDTVYAPTSVVSAHFSSSLVEAASLKTSFLLAEPAKDSTVRLNDCIVATLREILAVLLRLHSCSHKPSLSQLAAWVAACCVVLVAKAARYNGVASLQSPAKPSAQAVGVVSLLTRSLLRVVTLARELDLVDGGLATEFLHGYSGPLVHRLLFSTQVAPRSHAEVIETLQQIHGGRTEYCLRLLPEPVISYLNSLGHGVAHAYTQCWMNILHAFDLSKLISLLWEQPSTAAPNKRAVVPKTPARGIGKEFDAVASVTPIQPRSAVPAAETIAEALPISAHRLKLVYCIARHTVSIVKGDTGSGKSSQVPQLCLDATLLAHKFGSFKHAAADLPGEMSIAGIAVPAEVLEGWGSCSPNIYVTQPRRVAAISLAERVAAERGEELGHTVGYYIAARRVSGRDTKIKFVTTGWMLQWLIHHSATAIEDAEKPISHIIIDEVHERTVDVELVCLVMKFALVRYYKMLAHEVRALHGTNVGRHAHDRIASLYASRPRVVLMSATFDTSIFENYFGTISEDFERELIARVKAGADVDACLPTLALGRVPAALLPYQDDLQSTRVDGVLTDNPCTLYVGAKRYPVTRIFLDDLDGTSVFDAMGRYPQRVVAELCSNFENGVKQARAAKQGFSFRLSKKLQDNILLLAASVALAHVHSVPGCTETIIIFVAGAADIEEVIDHLTQLDPDNVWAPPIQKAGAEDIAEELDVAAVWQTQEQLALDNAHKMASGDDVPATPMMSPLPPRSITATEPVAAPNKRIRVLPMHSLIALDQQMEAFRTTTGSARIVVATNIAESSITLPDVSVVIDTGAVKAIDYDEKLHTSVLRADWVSKASATQRAGRAGRVRPGTVYSLYSRSFHDIVMRPYDTPEMLRLNLASVVLNVKRLQISLLGKVSDTHVTSAKEILGHCLQSPNEGAIETALASLGSIGALSAPDDSGAITDIGRALVSFPGELTFGRFLLFGSLLDCVPDAIVCAAICCSQDVFVMPNAQLSDDKEKYLDTVHRMLIGRLTHGAEYVGSAVEYNCSDIITTRNAYLRWAAFEKKDPKRSSAWCWANGIVEPRMRAVHSLVREIASKAIAQFRRAEPELQMLQRLDKYDLNQLFSASNDVLRVLMCLSLNSNMLVGTRQKNEALLAKFAAVDVPKTAVFRVPSLPPQWSSSIGIHEVDVSGNKAFIGDFARALRAAGVASGEIDALTYSASTRTVTLQAKPTPMPLKDVPFPVQSVSATGVLPNGPLVLLAMQRNREGKLQLVAPPATHKEKEVLLANGAKLMVPGALFDVELGDDGSVTANGPDMLSQYTWKFPQGLSGYHPSSGRSYSARLPQQGLLRFLLPVSRSSSDPPIATSVTKDVRYAVCSSYQLISRAGPGPAASGVNAVMSGATLLWEDASRTALMVLLAARHVDITLTWVCASHPKQLPFVTSLVVRSGSAEPGDGDIEFSKINIPFEALRLVNDMRSRMTNDLADILSESAHVAAADGDGATLAGVLMLLNTRPPKDVGDRTVVKSVVSDWRLRSGETAFLERYLDIVHMDDNWGLPTKYLQQALGQPLPPAIALGPHRRTPSAIAPTILASPGAPLAGKPRSLRPTTVPAVPATKGMQSSAIGDLASLTESSEGFALYSPFADSLRGEVAHAGRSGKHVGTRVPAPAAGARAVPKTAAKASTADRGYPSSTGLADPGAAAGGKRQASLKKQAATAAHTGSTKVSAFAEAIAALDMVIVPAETEKTKRKKGGKTAAATTLRPPADASHGKAAVKPPTNIVGKPSAAAEDASVLDNFVKALREALEASTPAAKSASAHAPTRPAGGAPEAVAAAAGGKKPKKAKKLKGAKEGK